MSQPLRSLPLHNLGNILIVYCCSHSIELGNSKQDVSLHNYRSPGMMEKQTRAEVISVNRRVKADHCLGSPVIPCLPCFLFYHQRSHSLYYRFFFYHPTQKRANGNNVVLPPVGMCVCMLAKYSVNRYK